MDLSKLKDIQMFINTATEEEFNTIKSWVTNRIENDNRQKIQEAEDQINDILQKLRYDGFYLVNKNVDEVSYFNMFYDEDVNNIEMSLE
nr:MAG TPA: hypothetical protein [Caudoviricetes sp.]